MDNMVTDFKAVFGAAGYYGEYNIYLDENIQHHIEPPKHINIGVWQGDSYLNRKPLSNSTTSLS